MALRTAAFGSSGPIGRGEKLAAAAASEQDVSGEAAGVGWAGPGDAAVADDEGAAVRTGPLLGTEAALEADGPELPQAPTRTSERSAARTAVRERRLVMRPIMPSAGVGAAPDECSFLNRSAARG